MARGHFNGWAIDSEGNAMGGAAVYVYDNGTSTPVSETIYENDTGDDTTLANPIITANDGFFEFYLDAPIEVTLKITKSGYEDKTFRADVINANLASGVTDHGALTGLGDDDHSIYALADGSRGDFALDSDLTAHTGAFGTHFSGAAMAGPGGNINAASWTDRVTWSSFAYETGENYGTSGDDYFTIPTTGVYRVNFGLTMQFTPGFPTAGANISAAVLANHDIAQIQIFDVGFTPSPTQGSYYISRCRDISLTAGDTVALYGREDTDQSATVDTREYVTYFSIQRLA